MVLLGVDLQNIPDHHTQGARTCFLILIYFGKIPSQLLRDEQEEITLTGGVWVSPRGSQTSQFDPVSDMRRYASFVFFPDAVSHTGTRAEQMRRKTLHKVQSRSFQVPRLADTVRLKAVSERRKSTHAFM